MAQLWSTGPAHIYLATGKSMPGDISSALTAGTPVYLGTAEGAPNIEVQPHYTPVMNDVGGQSVPIDYAFDGEEAVIVVDLTRWNETVYKQLVARPNSQDNTRGTYGANDIGSLMLTEGLTFDTWVQFPYFAKTVYSGTNGGVGGYRFGATFCIGPDGITPGTRASKRRVILKCIRALDPATMIQKLYDHDMTGIPDTPPNNSTGAVGS